MICRVLVVDDDLDDVLLTGALLRGIENTHFEIDSAGTMEEVEACLAAGPHDVYLVDYRLARVTGIDVAVRILAADPHAPVIMLTGYDDYAVDVRAAAVGVVDFLVKGGLDARTLERAIRYAVKQQAAQRALAESEERYALAMAGAKDGLWDWDIAADTLFFSPGYLAMLGYAEGEVGATPQEWFARVHPDDQPEVEQAIRDHLRGRSDHYESEHRMQVRDGTYRWMLARGLVVRGPDGKPSRLAGSQSDVTDRKRAQLQLEHDALHDSLTGLPNRVLFRDRLSHLIGRGLRRTGASAVLVFDLDRFKVINDSLGHMVGDQLLCEVSLRLLEALRPGDTVARVGADEFTILLEELADYREAERIAERVLDALKAPFSTDDDREVYLSASIGIAMVPLGVTPEEVIRDADAAMYRAKAEGKGRYAMFDTAQHAAVVNRLELETRLRRGLFPIVDGAAGLQIAYQPIVRTTGGTLHGFEALARWSDAEGTLTPDEFIPIAEETGLIASLGRLVLREACRQLAEWRREYVLPELAMAVNISGRQLLEPSFYLHVESALSDFGLDPDAVRLEITETAAAADAEAVHGALQALHARTGVSAHLDDFGTGAASLTVLRGFPGDTLKIDRSFVLAMGADTEAFQIVKAVVGLAHAMGMGVVAEGVESQWQLDLLRELRCEFVQGFLLAKPLDPRAAGRLLARGMAAVA